MIENGRAYQIALLQMTGQRTVPAVYVNDTFVGGNDATQSLYASGSLASMLQK